jgi:hypothetical protein
MDLDRERLLYISRKFLLVHLNMPQVRKICILYYREIDAPSLPQIDKAIHHNSRFCLGSIRVNPPTLQDWLIFTLGKVGYMHVPACMSVCMYVCMHVCVCMYVCRSVCMYVCVCVWNSSSYGY